MENDIVTVKDLIEFLEGNFKPEDKLCFFDEGGAWCEISHVPISFIGDRRWMFNYVKDKMKSEMEGIRLGGEDAEHMKKILTENYRMVEDGDVVIF